MGKVLWYDFCISMIATCTVVAKRDGSRPARHRACGGCGNVKVIYGLRGLQRANLNRYYLAAGSTEITIERKISHSSLKVWLTYSLFDAFACRCAPKFPENAVRMRRKCRKMPAVLVSIGDALFGWKCWKKCRPILAMPSRSPRLAPGYLANAR